MLRAHSSKAFAPALIKAKLVLVIVRSNPALPRSGFYLSNPGQIISGDASDIRPLGRVEAERFSHSGSQHEHSGMCLYI